MDPISLAGLGLGAVSLAFELFSSCVKGYNLIIEANNMPKTCSYLLVRLQMEKEKLLSWAVLAKLSDDDRFTSGGPGLRLNRHTVIDTLREIQVLLLDFAQLDKRYNLTLVPAPSPLSSQKAGGEGTSTVTADQTALRSDYSILQKKALSFIDKTKGISTAANWWLNQRLSASSQPKRGRALSDRKYPKDVYVCAGLGLYMQFFSP
ncbi:prion-inhibition and propagation-domain-containing protein [Apodospora peruviana]|uniref:Prion-inhibition and propagation-domain-containing protein n=1 Tax=Apodospora peruviana TaxID=516989 RepID=A0AAE0I1E4_9PEZI|nr:prion-inhibition and propagation-domain-containing protein [Apodospora peruviana]